MIYGIANGRENPSEMGPTLEATPELESRQKSNWKNLTGIGVRGNDREEGLPKKKQSQRVKKSGNGKGTKRKAQEKAPELLVDCQKLTGGNPYPNEKKKITPLGTRRNLRTRVNNHGGIHRTGVKTPNHRQS